MNKIGSYYCGKNIVYDILVDYENNKFYTKDNTEILEFDKEDLIYCLTNPWDSIYTFEDEDGVHYNSIVYDFIWIDIYGKDLKELFNILSFCFKPNNEESSDNNV